MLVARLLRIYRGSLAAITGQAREAVNTSTDCLWSTGCISGASYAQLPVGTPFVLGSTAPDTSVAAVQRPPQTRCGHRARSAYLLGFFDLGQRGSRGAEGKEQVGINVATGGVATPVRIHGAWLPLEKALARVTHQPRHLSSSWARAATLVLSRPGYQGFRAAGRLPSLRTPIFAPQLPVPAEPLLAATRTRWPGWAACQSCVRGKSRRATRDRWRRLVKPNRVPGPGVHARLYGVWPRIRLMPRNDSSDFAKNPAAGLSSIISL